MSRLPVIIPVTDLRQNTNRVLEELRAADEPVVITQRGRAAAVLLSVATYEAREKERELLRLLAQGEKEIAAGEGVALDDVLADADTLLDGGEAS